VIGVLRWEAFEERFIVAERKREVLAALRYRTASKRHLLGFLVTNPWAVERPLAMPSCAAQRTLIEVFALARGRVAPIHGIAESIYSRKHRHKKRAGAVRPQALFHLP
jgi:hypothetical protein